MQRKKVHEKIFTIEENFFSLTTKKYEFNNTVRLF